MGLSKLISKDGKFYSKVFSYALPIAFQSLITIGVNMLDTMMVGKLGEKALSATSQANSFISIYQIFCMGLGMGASVLVSRYWGIKSTFGEKGIMVNDEEEKATNALKQTIALMLRLTLLLATIFALISYFFPGFIMGTYGKDADTISEGINYLSYSVPTFFFLGASLVVTIVLRSVGQVRLPLFVSIGAFFINFICNYTFIFGHFGMPRLGVAGAALGTLIARIFEASMICGYLFFVDKRIGFKIKDIFMDTKSLLGEYIRICIPVLISDGILAFGNNSVTMVIGHLGTDFASANGITSVTQQLSSVMVQGVSQAGAIVTGQTLGEGEKEKTWQQGYWFLGLGFLLGIISAIFIFVIKGAIISSFDGVESTTRQLADSIMIAICVIVIFQSTNSIMTKGVLRGGGDTKVLMFTDNIFLWLLALPLGLLAGFVFKLSPFWIYICLKSDQIIKTIWCVLRLRSGKWIKKISTGDGGKRDESIND